MPEYDVAATAPAKGQERIFYGWYIVAVGFLTQLAHSTALSSTLGVLFKPMSEEFGWQRSYLSGLRSFESLACGIMMLLLGPLLDRSGIRRALVASGVITGLGFILVGQVTDSLQFFLLHGVTIIVGSSLFNNVVNAIPMSNWFRRNRGRAMGMSGAGTSVGKVFLAHLLTLLSACRAGVKPGY